MSKWIVTLQALLLVFLASCETPHLEIDAPKSDNIVTLPDEVDGEIDTYWEYLISGEVECGTPDVCELFKRGAMDSYLGYIFRQARLSGVAPLNIRGLTEEEYQLVFERSRRENTEWIKQRINKSGWFNRNSFGAVADDLAFNIVQHSDYDVDFQIKVLEILKAQLETNGTKAQNVAYLTDRVARANNTPQVYGTQGQCSDGEWVPLEISEVESVNRRRSNVGLGSLEKYIESNNKNCP